MCKIFCVIPGTREDCIELLNNGHLLCIAPGGLREALFSDPARYNLMWAKRLGFARVIVATNTVVCHFLLRFFQKFLFTKSVSCCFLTIWLRSLLHFSGSYTNVYRKLSRRVSNSDLGKKLVFHYFLPLNHSFQEVDFVDFRFYWLVICI